VLPEHELDSVLAASHGDPFAVLGVHEDAQHRFWLRAFLPGAARLTVLEARSGASLGKPCSIELDLPPLATVILECKA
jgi:1,4-alpha-glucan branching enzyme